MPDIQKVHPEQRGSKHKSLPAVEVNPKKLQVLQFLNSKGWTICISIFTVYALVGDDLRLNIFAVSTDNVFFSFSTIALLLFMLELGMNVFSKESYLGSFYFVLDTAATISLIPDIGWIWDSFIESVGDDEGSSSALKAGRASRAGTKAGRIVRIVRLVRMVRIVKLYKMSKGDDTEMTEEIANEPSKVGKKMSEMTTRKVIIIVLLLVLFIPIFDGGIDAGDNEYETLGLQRLQIVAAGIESSDPLEENTYFRKLTEDYIRDAGRLLYLELAVVPQSVTNSWVADIKFQKVDDPSSIFNETISPDNGWEPSLFKTSLNDVYSNYRNTEVSVVSSEGCYNSAGIVTSSEDACVALAIFDISPSTQYAAGMNLFKTFFIMVVLGIAAVEFSKIAEALVITPIERMMLMVQKLRENPLANTSATGHQFESDKKAKENGYETALLEATLMKIGALMQVGFGAAGADIIGKNMQQGALDTMLPGKKITAIYGFCDIRQFTDTTECLQEEVMVYVNKLGDIIHTDTHKYYGMANKNVGDAFLLSWKICDGILEGFSNFTDVPDEKCRELANNTVKCPPNAGGGSQMREITPTEMADSALTAFLKCLIDLDNANTDGCLTEYLTHPRVVARFGPNFRIRMGFGLHVGWAIEGAIGSKYKIDATYISPHVQMADRLEAGSKIFRTPMNLSHWFVGLLSPAARSYLRKMDRISVSGVSEPVTVYTYDVTKYKKGFGTPKLDALGQQIPVDFKNDSQYKEIREGLNPKFIPAFKLATDLYFKGEFQQAKMKLLSAMELKKDDGPSAYLMEVLESYDFVAPEDWKGFRAMGGY